MPEQDIKTSNNVVPKIVIGAILLGFVALIGSLSSANPSAKNRIAGISNPAYPELNELQNRRIASFKDLSKYFNDLAEKKGGEYAFKVLVIAPLPPNTDMHLLGHTVGDVLYKQKGIKGIQACTQDFRNACSHSIVVGFLLEKGEGVLAEISEICKQAPGGAGAYTMCFHGLGHGVLAYTGYDMPKAVKLCEKTDSWQYNNRESIECIGGAVMEIISGGFHNQELWEVQSKKYLPHSNPLYPCASDYMPQKARYQCYVYLTPHLFKVVGANMGSPLPEDFEKAFKLCGMISEVNINGELTACYGGFGKEFVAIAKARDIRNIDKMTSEEMSLVDDWCALAKNEKGILDCILNAAGSIYWGGENDRAAVIRFCNVIKKSTLQNDCFKNIIGLVNYYISDQNYKREFCSELPQRYNADCLNTILNN